ncbi:MAG: DNA methyltransferase [Thermoprotei archaeon]
MVTRDRLNFTYTPLLDDYQEPIIKTYVGDARNLDEIKDESIDLIVTHPPYSNIIPYSKRIDGDLSNLNITDYLTAMREIAKESFRVLKKGKYCAILIGDTRRRGNYIPIAFKVMQQFLDAGFILKEDIIKLQHHVLSDRRWRSPNYNFFKIMHEHIFVFRKPNRS